MTKNATLRLPPSKMSDDQTNFAHRLLLTNRQVVSFVKVFADTLLPTSNFQKYNYPK